jgi:hypothetical protein
MSFKVSFKIGVDRVKERGRHIGYRGTRSLAWSRKEGLYSATSAFLIKHCWLARRRDYWWIQRACARVYWEQSTSPMGNCRTLFFRAMHLHRGKEFSMAWNSWRKALYGALATEKRFISGEIHGCLTTLIQTNISAEQLPPTACISAAQWRWNLEW